MTRRRKLLAFGAGLMLLVLPGCEACNGGMFHESDKIAPQIIDKVEAICGPDRDGVRGGVENIMLMEAREDDGIVTCHDGTNHYFDA